jgi:hypothetical protein
MNPPSDANGHHDTAMLSRDYESCESASRRNPGGSPNSCSVSTGTDCGSSGLVSLGLGLFAGAVTIRNKSGPVKRFARASAKRPVRLARSDAIGDSAFL